MRHAWVALVALPACAPAGGTLGDAEPASPDTEAADSGAADSDGDGFDASVDCDDTRADVHPGAVETCDGRDDDCDGSVDVGAKDAPTWYSDADADGFGDSAVSASGCDPPAGYAATSGDCDDGNSAANPGSSELCATPWDDDCDGLTNEDDAADAAPSWPDADGDGYGDASAAPDVGCELPSGHVAVALDCDDVDPDLHPLARDVCNDAVDQNCDGVALTCPYSGTLAVDDIAIAKIEALGLFDAVWNVGAGDVQGDGVPDLLITGYYANQVVIVSDVGSASGVVVIATDTAYTLIDGNSPTSFGTGLHGGGDLDGDGLGDLLVGVENDSTSAYAAGAIDVFTGPVGVGASYESAYATLVGEDVTDRLTFSPMAADLDGDGFDDLVAGTPMQGAESGAVYLTWGPIPPGEIQAGQDTDVRLRGDPGSYFGCSTSAGDLDGDGYLDLAVGAPLDAARAGVVHLFSGATLRSAPAEGQLADGRIVGEGRFGTYLDARGDYDASGRADLLVDAPMYGSGFAYPGRAYVFTDPPLVDGSVADASVTLDGSEHAGYTGSFQFVGDVNGDSFDDAILADGYYGDGGVAFLFYGPISPAITDMRDADATILGASGDRLGGFVDDVRPAYALGDVDVDGFADIVLNSGQHVLGGWVYVLRGAAGP